MTNDGEARPAPAEVRAEITTARESAAKARESAAQARAIAAEAREGAARAREDVEAIAEADPLVDPEVRGREVGVDDDNPLGRPGRPLSRRSPFLFGMYAAFGVATAYLVIQILVGARQVLILLLVSSFLALGLDPAVRALERRGVTRRNAITLVFFAVIGFFVSFAAAAVPPVANQATTFVAQLPEYLEKLQSNPQVARLDSRFQLIERAREYVARDDFGTRALGGFVGFGKAVLTTTLSALTVLILTLYLLGSLPSIKQTAYRLVPRSRRARVALLGDEILGKVGGYVAGALTIAAIAGTSAFLFLLIVGAPYPLALAMLIAITDLIPLIGATIGAIVVTMVCFFVSVPVGIATAVFFLAYQQVENYLIYPRVMGRTVDVSPAATIVAALIGGAFLGVPGALLAIPSAAAISLIIREVLTPRMDAA